MSAVLISSLRARVSLFLARKLVDAEYYLNRYPDVRAAGVDPIRHFAECGYAVPIRAANPSMERAIIRLSPLLALAVVLLPIRRDDWVQCFVARYQELWCGDLGLEFRFSRWVARLLAHRIAQGNWPTGRAYNQIVGTTLPIVRIGDDRPWLSIDVIESQEIYHFTSPRIWNARRKPTTHQVTLPALWSATVRNASVFGTMQVTANANYLVYEPAADPNLSFAAGQHRHVIACYPPRANKIVAQLPDCKNNHLEEAIILGGRCSNNHFHFLIEYLTRGYIIEKSRLAEDIPLIVTDNIFPTQAEAINLLFPNRSLVRMPSHHRIDVDKLYIPSIMTYLPDALEITDWKKDGVRGTSLRWLRERAYKNLSIDFEETLANNRIYLKRERGRNILNASEVEAVFREHGFRSVDPSKLSFAQQVKLFASATHVAGPLGAAFSNTVFCRPGTSILGIGGRHGVRSSIFQNIAEIGGCIAVNFVSDMTPRDCLRLRANAVSLRQGSYSINAKELGSFVKNWLD